MFCFHGSSTEVLAKVLNELLIEGETLTLFGRWWSNEVVSALARQELYKKLPSVDELLNRPELAASLQRYPRDLVVSEIRGLLEEIRRAISEGPSNEDLAAERDGFETERITRQVTERLNELLSPSLRKVINATGVILHTNLGRAPLSEHALEAIRAAAAGYSNLEYDVVSGRRGKRDVHAAGVLDRLLGAPAVVVNNNAAAVFLVLNELAAGGEVIVSRGELIEIGDGFRIPDIMARSGARLREIGTTNRTHIEDYRDAVNEDTRLLLRVHRSNFKIVGFTCRPALAELVELGRAKGLPVVEDLGSGCMFDVAAAGLADEPPAAQSLREGADLVTFSGDKLLGGPQAGIIAGRAEWVQRVRRNPLFRALRVDKLTYAALEATLRDYLLQHYEEIPILRMLSESEESVRERAQRLIDAAGAECRNCFELLRGESVLGGGSTPAQTFPTALLGIEPPAGFSAAGFESRLRKGNPPLIARCENDRVVLDLRTVLPSEEADLTRVLLDALTSRR